DLKVSQQMATQKMVYLAIGALGLAVLVPVGLGVMTANQPNCGDYDRLMIQDPDLMLPSSSGSIVGLKPDTTARLFYFGYSYCPAMCPFDLSRNVDATEQLQTQGTLVEPVFVTIDPQRDTQDWMQDYTQSYSDTLLGLSGSLDQTETAKQQFQVYAKRVDDDPEFYLFDHSTLTYLWKPNTNVVEIFRNDLSSEQLAQQIACVMNTA
ncbi:MAG: SCO family protein, partial [Pseudomonadota bacterium]